MRTCGSSRGSKPIPKPGERLDRPEGRELARRTRSGLPAKRNLSPGSAGLVSPEAPTAEFAAQVPRPELRLTHVRRNRAAIVSPLTGGLVDSGALANPVRTSRRLRVSRTLRLSRISRTGPIRVRAQAGGGRTAQLRATRHRARHPATTLRGKLPVTARRDRLPAIVRRGRRRATALRSPRGLPVVAVAAGRAVGAAAGAVAGNEFPSLGKQAVSSHRPGPIQRGPGPFFVAGT